MKSFTVLLIASAALVASVSAAPSANYDSPAPAPAADYNGAAAPAQSTPCTKSLATAAPVATNAYDAAKPDYLSPPKPTAAAYDAAAPVPAPAATTPCDQSKTAAPAVTQAAYDAPAVQENPYSDVTKKSSADDRLVTTGETIMRERFESSAMGKSSSSFVAVVAVVGAGALLF